MKKPIKKTVNLLILCLGLGMFFSTGHGFGGSLFALEGTQGTQQDSGQPASGSPSGSNIVLMDSSQQEIQDQMAKRQAFLQEIQQQLEQAKNNYVDIHHNATDTQNKLVDTEEQRLTLQNQLDILNDQIKNTVEMTQNVLMQIQQKENQIAVLKDDIAIKNIEIENQKKMMAEYLKVLYQQQNSMVDTTDKNEAVNIAKLLLSDKTPAEALRELKYFNVLEQTGHDIFDKLQNLLNEQEAEQTNLENSRNKLEMLYRQLQEQQSTLQMQQQAKAQLLSETQGQETIYQQLLDQTGQEESQALDDIKALSNNLKFIQDKIAELGNKFNPDDYKSVLDGDTTNVYQYIKDNPDGDFEPQWPVTPSRGISAYFHDPSYLKAMGIPHEAIDIPTPQSTPIHAPADGVVYKTRDNGYGYSYIILAHAGGFMTLYGHVSEIDVKEGQKIKQGQVIGLSGATPGTKGAGLLTTGPHLHFEVMKGGKHVDPLDYLPLEYLPLNSLPAKYLSRITGDAYNVSRTAPQSLSVVQNSEQLLQMAEQSGNVEVNGGTLDSAEATDSAGSTGTAKDAPNAIPVFATQASASPVN